MSAEPTVVVVGGGYGGVNVAKALVDSAKEQLAKTTIVSPITRPKPSSTAEMMPDDASSMT